MVEDLEAKNRVLHKCAYTAHSKVEELLKLENEDGLVLAAQLKAELFLLKSEMEKILASGGAPDEPRVLTQTPEIIL